MDNESFLDLMARTNAVFNLSEADHLISPHESESDETDGEDGDDPNSDSASSEGEEGDNPSTAFSTHVPIAPWFSTEAFTYNNVTNNSGDFSSASSVNPLGSSIFQGQCFEDKQSAIDSIKSDHIRESRNYRVVKSTPTLYEGKCVVDDCPWRIRVTLRKKYGFFEITKLPAAHTCLLRTIERDHQKLSSSLIASTIKQQVLESPSIKVNNIMTQMITIYKYHVSYKKAWLGKQKAISDVYGDWTTSYSKLPQLLSALMYYNPGTVALIEAEVDVDASVCKRVWWSFKPMIEGWQHARPVISIDGTFLKERYTGVLLIAMGFDSNNQQYPLAFGSVDKETTSNWSWFLYHLRRNVCRERMGKIQNR
nr:PREDICTED: uncharacterized protein LOC108212188 [Daucus carota subsp. sativus]